MPIKFSVPTVNTKKIGASSVKKNSSNLISSKTQGAPASALATIPVTKNAQFAGSGANVTMTQPMFFSPLHTPQNWQQPSKRREQYMWARFYMENEPKVAAGVNFYCFDPLTPLLMADGAQKSIYTTKIGDRVRCHDGTVGIVEKVHVRQTEEEMLKIFISGISQGPLMVTKGHEILVYRDDKTSFIRAEELKIGDYLVTPAKYNADERHQVSFDEDFVWLLGVYAAEGCGIPYEHESLKHKIERHYQGIYFCLSYGEYKDFAQKIKEKVTKLYPDCSITIRQDIDHGTTIVSVYGRNIADDLCGLVPGIAKDGSKRFASVICSCSKSNIKSILNGFMSGDGCFNKNNGFQGVGVSKKLCEQIANFCDILGLPYSFTMTRISKGNRQICYNIRISRRACQDLVEGSDNHKFYVHNIDDDLARNTPYEVKDNFIIRKIRKIKNYFYDGEVYDLTISGAHTYVVNRIAVHNSDFSMSGFILECSNGKILRYFEKQVKDLKLNHWLKMISHEYYMLGDVFPFTEIECTSCGGSGVTKDGKSCNHPDGKIKRIVVLNPDWIEVQSNALASEPVISLVPDEDLREIVAKREPRQIYDRLPKKLIEMVSKGLPIQLSNRCVSHIKHNASPYGIYGTSLIRRLFTILAYKTKIMTANWIIAERLILPVRIVKVGSDARPATAADILDTSNQLSAVANDPNLTLVTHHNLEYNWEGAAGKIQNVTAEIEQIGKEILDGLMLNQALLNGEMTCHDEETLTLTEDGFKKYNEVTENDKIGCYNPETKKIEYHNYLEKNVYDYSGEMVKFGSDKIDILVTPNHRMWINSEKGFNFVEAKDVENGSEIITKPIWRRQEDSSFETSKIESIEKVPYSGKVFCFRVPYGLFVTKRNGRITIQGNSYSGAQVGVETMIKRLQSWQNTLSEWVENNIFLPIAMMQGFIDEKATKELDEPQYIYPTIKWNDLNLRDKSGHLQLMMQLHDNRIISTQKLLEEFDIDYDQETERLREEAIMAGPAGQVGGMGGAGGAAPGAFGGIGGGGGGAPLGGSPMEGGMPGMPTGQPGMPGPEMGGGMGGAPGGPAGAAGGAMGAPGGAPGATAALLPPNFKIGKKGKGGKSLEEMYKPLPPKFVRLTKLEQKMYRILQGADIPNQLFTQYAVSLPGEKQPFVLDFAYPNLGMGIESNGKIWHENAEAKIRDQQRDQKLANIGWRILRFNEEAIQQQPEAVKAVIQEQVALAKKDKMKKKGENIDLIKEASIFEGIKENNIIYDKIILDNNLGCLYLIGSK